MLFSFVLVCSGGTICTIYKCLLDISMRIQLNEMNLIENIESEKKHK